MATQDPRSPGEQADPRPGEQADPRPDERTDPQPGKHPDERTDPQPDELPAVLARLDRLQRRSPALAVPLAVYKKFADDEAGKLAALISYYAFLSVFPLLIVLATVLSHVLVGHPDLADEIVSTAAGSFLSIGATGTIEPLDVSGLALAIAIIVGLWAGLAVANAMQDAMNAVYEVPKVHRPGFIPSVLRSLSLLVVVGVGLPTTTVLQGLAAEALGGPLGEILPRLLALAINTALIAIAFRWATVARTSWRGVLPGAVVAAAAWTVMQALATSLLTRQVEGAQADYGAFAIVIGLLFWFFLLAQVTIACAELNVVLTARLWPRSLKSLLRAQAETEADIRAYAQYPAREQQALNVEVSTTVVPMPGRATRTPKGQ